MSDIQICFLSVITVFLTQIDALSHLERSKTKSNEKVERFLVEKIYMK